MVRACAGFNVLGLFYDNQNKTGTEFGDTTYQINKDKFKEIMGSYPEEWYIKSILVELVSLITII